MRYYISGLPDDFKLELNVPQFLTAMSKHWPGIYIEERGEIWCSHEWEIHTQSDVLTGRIHPSGQILSLEGVLEDVAAFALWFRSYVDKEQELSMFDDQYDIFLELTEKTTHEDIVKAFSGEYPQDVNN